MPKDYIEREDAIKLIQGTGYADQIKDNLLFILRTIPGFVPDDTAADVRPVEEVDAAVDEAIRVINALNGTGRLNYGDYSELHDTICAISSADMREVTE